MIPDKFRILAIDDEKDILELINITLGTQYEVVTLADPFEAFELMEVVEPDMLIVDIMMPKVTGYQIVEFIRKDQKYQNLPIIVLSAKDTGRDIKYGYKLGVNVYLTKPFQPERLLKNVQSVLSTNVTGRPRRKGLSFKDVTLRLQVKMGHAAPPDDLAAQQQQQQADGHDSNQFKLKRLLAQEKQKKEWLD